MVKIEKFLIICFFVPILAVAQVTNDVSTNVPLQTNSPQINHYSKGFQFFLKKNYAKASQEFILELNQNFENFNAYYYLGFCYKNLKQYDNALFTFNRALELKNKNKNYLPAIYQAMADIYFKKKDYDRSISIVLHAIKKGYRSPSLLNLLAKVYLYKNDLIRAQKAIELSLELDDVNSQAYNLLGLLYMAQKNYSKAVTAFLVAIGFDNKYYYYYSNLGYAYELLGLYDKSLKAYQSALALKTNSFSLKDSVNRIKKKIKEIHEE